MDKEKKISVCSSNNKCIQTIIGNIEGSRYYSKSLRVLIDGYYEIYRTAYNSFEEFKKKIMTCYNGKSADIFKNMTISNLDKDDNNVYKFELVADYPVSFRLPFTFNPSDKNFEYVGDEEENIYYLIRRHSYSEDDLKTLEESLSSFIKINKSYIFKLEDSLPYVICFDHNHVSISDANDECNNMVSLVDIDLENETLSFHESISNNEFTAIFKDYLSLILENAYVKESDVSKEIGYIGYPNFQMVDHLLTKYNMIEKKVEKKEPIKEPDGKRIYLLNVPNEGYKPIVGYKDVGYEKGEHRYKFEFGDYSSLLIPIECLVVVDGYARQAKTSAAYEQFKKLTLQPPKKDEE